MKCLSMNHSNINKINLATIIDAVYLLCFITLIHTVLFYGKSEARNSSLVECIFWCQDVRNRFMCPAKEII